MRKSKITQREIALGKRIRRLRKQKDLTQEKLAEKVGVSVTHIGLIETGKRGVSMKTLEKIARSLSSMVKDLINF